jgi:hypothetical protein
MTFPSLGVRVRGVKYLKTGQLLVELRLGVQARVAGPALTQVAHVQQQVSIVY